MAKKYTVSYYKASEVLSDEENERLLDSGSITFGRGAIMTMITVGDVRELIDKNAVVGLLDDDLIDLEN